MKALVTGGSGFIGSHVVDKLMASGHSVRIIDLKAPHRKDIEYLKGSILSTDILTESIKDIDIIYHFAAASNIDLVKDNPIATVEHNVMGTARLLEEARTRNINRFVLASSVYVHDTKGHLYTTSKLTSERLCKDYNKLFSLPYTILRIGTAYGPRSRSADVISIFVQRAAANQDLIIHGNGLQKRNFIYVEDIANACVRVAEESAANKTFVIAGRKAVTIQELSLLVKSLINPDLKIIIKNEIEREGDYLGDIEDVQRSEIELGWEPEIDLISGIKKYFKWYTAKMKQNNAKVL